MGLDLGVQLPQALTVPWPVGEGPEPAQPPTLATLCVFS